MEFDAYLKETLGYDYQENESNLMFNCPFCDDHKHDYKLYFKKADDSSHGIWQCWRCGRKGSPYGFVMQYEGVDFKEAAEILELYGMEPGSFTKEERESGLSEEEILYLRIKKMGEVECIKTEELTPPPLPNGYKRIIDSLDDPEVKPFIHYLINVRGLTLDDIITHNIGYITRGVTQTPSGSKVDLSNHVVFLTHGFKGEYLYWNTRSIEPDPYAKSINGFSKQGEYSKNNILFNLNRAIQTPYIVIVEGVIDALTIGNSGVAALGKMLTSAQIDLLKTYVPKDKPIFIMLDKDARDEAIKLAKKLKVNHKQVFIVDNPVDRDPNDMGTYESWQTIKDHSIKATKENLLLMTLK